MASAPSSIERLSYRDLAERLGISPDAARMKATRKVKAGLWKVVPGNCPSDQVTVEIPANEIGARRRRKVTIHAKRKAERTPESAPNNMAERLLDELAAPPSGKDELTDKLIGAKDVLAIAYDKLISLHGELVAAKRGLVIAQQATVDAKEAHRRDASEFAAAERRESGTRTELERALDDLAVMKLRMTGKQQPRAWWRLGR